MSGLTDAERTVLISEVLSRTTGDGITTPLLAEGILAAVEQIITARLDEYKARAVAAIKAECPGDHLAKPCKSCRGAARIIRDLT